MLVIDDKREEREPVFFMLAPGADITWATTMQEATTAMKEKGPFDVYCLDYDDGEERGGWYDVADLIRREDPYSIAKTVLIHSANVDARDYYDIFPAAIHIQWYVLATLLDFDRISAELIEKVVENVDSSYTTGDLIALVEKMQES